MGFQLPNPPSSGGGNASPYPRIDGQSQLFEYYANDTGGFVNNGWTPNSQNNIGNPVLNDTNWIGRIKRTRFESNSPNQGIGLFNGFNGGYAISTGVSGGFIYRHFFSTGNPFPTNCGFFSGVLDLTGMFDVNPSTLTLNMVGIYLDSGGTWGAICRTPASATTFLSGIARVVNDETPYFLEINALPGSGEVTFFLNQINNTDGSFTTIIDTTITTNLPAAGTPLFPAHNVWTGATNPVRMSAMQGSFLTPAPYAP